MSLGKSVAKNFFVPMLKKINTPQIFPFFISASLAPSAVKTRVKKASFFVKKCKKALKSDRFLLKNAQFMSIFVTF